MSISVPPPAGLSPRVRGNLRAYLKAHRVSRSIPACAGEPGAAVPELATYRVYPRVCGEPRER